jgi:hypothetical protein
VMLHYNFSIRANAVRVGQFRNDGEIVVRSWSSLR